MVEYVKVLESGDAVSYSFSSLKVDNPNTSFPKNPSESMLSDIGVFKVNQEKPESYDRLTQQVIEGDLENIDGVWVRKAKIVNLPKEKAKSNIREERDVLLKKSDWAVVYSTEKNEEVPEEWKTYRQALRDIPQQAGFPMEVTWPEKP